MKSPEPRLDILQGTLDLLILRTLAAGPMHGWSISGSLYPALHRLEHRGWIKAEWKTSELGRRARFYRLTASGRKQLELERENWTRLAIAIGRILELA